MSLSLRENAMKYLISALLFCEVLSAFGCKSPTAASGGPPSVTILPENFRGVQFVAYSFKAKITNHDPAFTYFNWNMGIDTMYYYTAVNQAMSIGYQKPGNYTITVKAFDFYTDSVIATATEQIVIDTALSSVEIIPQFYNGMLATTTLGVMDNFTLSVKSTLPASELYQFWDYGDGTTDAYKSGTITHAFPSPGTYLLRVDLYQKNGIYVGRDTALITINWPPFSPGQIKQMKKIEEYIFLDNTFPPVDKDHIGDFPLNFGEPVSGTNIHSSWSGNTFTIEYSDDYKDSKIAGTVSDDGMKIDSMDVHENYDDPNVTAWIDYKVYNMKLSFVTDDKIGFRLSGVNLKNNFTNFSYGGNFGAIVNFGNFDNASLFIKDRSVSQCVLVFSQQ
jgi:hypothetical protein